MDKSISKNFFEENGTVITAMILAAGITLRLTGLTTSAIWYDEALPFEAAKLPFLAMLDATKYTFSPPLWGTVVWISVRIFGQNEFGLRIPALLASVGSLWLLYKLVDYFGLSVNQKNTVLYFAALLPYQLSMAQDGRMYTILFALYLCAIWFAVHSNWFGLTASAGLMLYTHYTAPFYLIGVYFISITNTALNPRNLQKTIISGIVALLTFLPWLPAYIETLGIDSPVPPLSVYSFALMVYSIMFDYTLPQNIFFGLFLLLLLLSVTLALLFFIRQVFILSKVMLQPTIINKDTPTSYTTLRYIQLIIFALLPLTLMLAWNMLWKNFIYYRLLAIMLIPIIVWIVYTISRSVSWHVNYALLLVWSILLLTGIIQWSPQAKTGDLLDIASFINVQWQEGDVIYHITGTSYLPFSQYFEGKPEYLIDAIEHTWLLPVQLQDRFMVKRHPLESINYKRAWIFYSPNGLLSTQTTNRAQQYIHNANLIGIVKGWRFSPIEVYLLTAQP